MYEGGKVMSKAKFNDNTITEDEAIKILSVLHLGYGDRAKQACEMGIKAMLKEKANVPELINGFEYEKR